MCLTVKQDVTSWMPAQACGWVPHCPPSSCRVEVGEKAKVVEEKG